MKTIDVPLFGDHKLTLRICHLTGDEEILYDGERVSRQRHQKNFSVHSFEVHEDGTDALYEVNLFGGLWRIGYVVRRNGLVLVHKS